MSDLYNYEIDDLRAVWPESQYDNWIDDTGKTDLVSVIIPTYNRANLIRETLDSVYKQHYRPIEIIVVDDGSEDNTETVVRRWSERLSADDNLTVAYHRQENQGVASARNRGIKESQGRYIQLLDSDDKLHKDKVSSQVSKLRSLPQLHYVYCLTNHFGSFSSGEQVIGYDLNDSSLKRLTTSNPYQTSSALYNRSVVKYAGPFGINLTPVDDWEFAVRAYLASRGNVIFQNKAYNHQRSDTHPRLTSEGASFQEGRLKGMCHNKKVLRSLDLLDLPGLRSSVAFNFFRIAFLLDDFGARQIVLKRAFYHGVDIAPQILKVPLHITARFALANSWTGLFVLKKVIRAFRNVPHFFTGNN